MKKKKEENTRFIANETDGKNKRLIRTTGLRAADRFYLSILSSRCAIELTDNGRAERRLRHDNRVRPTTQSAKLVFVGSLLLYRGAWRLLTFDVFRTQVPFVLPPFVRRRVNAYTIIRRLSIENIVG